jgi:hypothetical protein
MNKRVAWSCPYCGPTNNTLFPNGVSDMWNEIAGKATPKTKHDVLCAWRPSYSGGMWAYEVLVHWPDGVWTDTNENEVDACEMPTHWKEIQQPAWTTSNAQVTGAAPTNGERSDDL